MSTNHTPNYNLCQWDADDKVLRADFNEDNARIDAALAGLAARDTEIEKGALKMEVGQYWGTGTSSHTVKLPFKAKFVLIQDSSQGTDTHMIFIGQNFCLAQPGYNPNLIDTRGGFDVKNTDTGITTMASGSSSQTELARIALNTSNHCYLYVAFA